jgi:hypothetical protein
MHYTQSRRSLSKNDASAWHRLTSRQVREFETSACDRDGIRSKHVAVTSSETYEIERTWFLNGTEFIISFARLVMTCILPFKFKLINTAGGTSAIVAKRSQIRPWFQRSCPKPNMLPCTRSRKRPISIVRSKATSETRVAMTFLTPVSVFSTTQTLCSGAHAARICVVSTQKVRAHAVVRCFEQVTELTYSG